MRVAQLLLVSALLVLGNLASAQIFAPQLGQQSLSNSSYAIDKNGKLWAWGANESGELGIGTSVDQSVPVQVPIPLGAGGWVHLAAGSNFALAVADSDRLYAWGSNRYGQLGSGSPDQSSPVRVTNPAGVKSWLWVTAGEDHSLALANTGMLYAWGHNDRGQLGSGDLIDYRSPHIVALPTGVHSWKAVAAGAGFTIAVSDRGDLYAWGYDSSGTWGSIRINAPVLISRYMLGAGFLPSLGAGNRVIVGLSFSGTTFSPGLGSALLNTIAVAAGAGHRLFLDVNGRLSARGSNLYGELGADDPFAESSSILFPQGVKQWVALAAGRHHSLALGNDGNLYAWGDNSHGQLGVGNNQSSFTPIAVRSFCDPIAMKGALSSSKDSAGLLLTASVRDTASAILVAATAFLTMPFPLVPQSELQQGMYPFTLLHNDSGSAQWQVAIDSSITVSGQALGYAYVYASGTAPIILPGSISLNVTRTRQYIVGTVVDSVTGQPLADAELNDPNGFYDTTDATGRFSTLYPREPFVVHVSRENYRTLDRTFTLPLPPDTAFIRIALLPAPIVGQMQTRTLTGPQSFTSLAALDSANLYATQAKSIIHSTDSGATWRTEYVAPDTLRDIAIVNAELGYAVGDHGTVVRIALKPAMYSIEGGLFVTSRLNAATAANGTLWAVGDSGVVLVHRGSGTSAEWSRESVLHEDLVSVASLSSETAVALTRSGKVIERIAGRGWVTMNIGVSANAIDLVEPDVVYLISNCYSTPGSLEYTYLSDPSLGASYVGAIGHDVKRLYFLNAHVGFAFGSNATSVTYDGGASWATLRDNGAMISRSVADGVGLRLWIADTSALRQYTMTSGAMSAVVTGRFVGRDGLSGIAGGKATVHASDGNDYSSYATAKGYYVVDDLPVGPDVQNVELRFTDTTGVWTYSDTTHLSAGEVRRIDFVHPLLGVAPAASATPVASMLRVLAADRHALSLEWDLLAANTDVHAEVFDALGRSMWKGRAAPIGHEHALRGLDLSAGVYFVRLTDAEGNSAVCALAIE